MSENEREQLQAQALDQHLTDLLSGRPTAAPVAMHTEQAAFARALIDQSQAIRPDAGFSRQLETRLRGAARKRVSAQTIAHPRPGENIWGKRGTIRMNKVLVYSLAGAALLALALFAALILYNPEQTEVGTGQVAQQPTATATPVPTRESLPATVQETRTPMPTPTTALTEVALPAPTAEPTGTAAPTPTPSPMPPLYLPALAEWAPTGYGGGGIGGPLYATRTYVLGTELPEGPSRMVVYVQLEPGTLTASDAAQIAGRLGLAGRVYQSIGMTAKPVGDAPRGYLAVDGPREAMFEATGIVYYTDRQRTSFAEGYWREPESVPPLEEALASAEAFLHAAGLLEESYQTLASGDTISFFRLIDNSWQLTEPFARVTLWEDGQVGQMQYWPLALDRWAEAPILSAAEAWEILRASPADGRVWHYPYRRAAAPPWGEWEHDNPTFWERSYQAGQQVRRFGVPQVWYPTTEGETPFLAIGDLVLAGDLQGLADYALEQYLQEEWTYVHVWGEIEQTGKVQTLRVSGWEPATESYWNGTIRRENGLDTLVTGDGIVVQLPDLPEEVPEGTEVSVSGGQIDDHLEWHIIQEMSYAVSPPATKAQTVMTVEQVDLVYLALPPNVIPPEGFSELSYRAVQPVWRFRGHSDEGIASEAYVQAVQPE